MKILFISLCCLTLIFVGCGDSEDRNIHVTQQPSQSLILSEGTYNLSNVTFRLSDELGSGLMNLNLKCFSTRDNSLVREISNTSGGIYEFAFGGSYECNSLLDKKGLVNTHFRKSRTPTMVTTNGIRFGVNEPSVILDFTGTQRGGLEFRLWNGNTASLSIPKGEEYQPGKWYPSGTVFMGNINSSCGLPFSNERLYLTLELEDDEWNTSFVDDKLLIGLDYNFSLFNGLRIQEDSYTHEYRNSLLADEMRALSNMEGVYMYEKDVSQKYGPLRLQIMSEPSQFEVQRGDINLIRIWFYTRAQDYNQERQGFVTSAAHDWNLVYEPQFIDIQIGGC